MASLVPVVLMRVVTTPRSFAYVVHAISPTFLWFLKIPQTLQGFCQYPQGAGLVNMGSANPHSDLLD